MKNPIKWLMNKLTYKLIESKEQKILMLAENLINELDMFSVSAGVQSIRVYFDYDHEKTRTINVNFNDFECKKTTSTKNKQFKL